MSDGKDWLEVADSIHTKVEITGLAMGASYTGWALEYKSMFGLERSLHINPNAALSYLGAGLESTAWFSGLGTVLKGVGFFNDLSVHVSDSSSLGIGSSLDVHRSAVHYSSNREKKIYFYLLLAVTTSIDLAMVIQSYKYKDKGIEEEKKKKEKEDQEKAKEKKTDNETKYDTSSTKELFYKMLICSNVVLNMLQILEIKANEITYTLTNLQANLAATTSRLKTLAGYETNILNQLHPMVSSQRLQAAKTILENCENHAEKAIKTAEKVANQLAGTHAP